MLDSSLRFFFFFLSQDFPLVKVRELARKLESIVNCVICFLCVVFVGDRL